MESSPPFTSSRVSVCVRCGALVSWFPFGSDVDRLSSVVLCSLLEQFTALFSVGTQSNTEICPIMLDIESRAAPLFAFGRDLGRGMGVEWGKPGRGSDVNLVSGK